MVSSLFATTALAVVASTLVSAQTSTKCDPSKDHSCPRDPAFGKGVAECDLSQADCEWLTAAEGSTIKRTDKGLAMTMAKASDAPTFLTEKYLFFGHVDVEMMGAPGQGIVSSIVLESDDLDEVDWEFVGNDNSQIQTNYFSQGDDSNFKRGGFAPVSNADTEFHTYSLDWTPERLLWQIDGVTVRTLNAADLPPIPNVYGYPQTPAKLKLGGWVPGSKNSPPGTVSWSGGLADLSQPHVAYIRKISITDYAGGNKAPSTEIKEYGWGKDFKGKAEDVLVIHGDGSNSDSDSDSSSSASASSTKTKSAHSSSGTASASATGSSMSSTMSTAMATSTSGSSSGSGSAFSNGTSTDSGSGSGSASSTGSGSGSAASPSSTVPGAASTHGAAFGAVALAGLLMFVKLF